MKFLFVLVLSLYGFSAASLASPAPLVIKDDIKPKTWDRYIRAVHQEIPVRTDNLNKVRYAILQGMLNTKGFSWVYDGEAEGYILARFDYRGDTNVIRIEYDTSWVQLKYHDALGDLVCDKEVDGICYDNSRYFYKYVRNLRKAIAAQMKHL